MAEWPLVLEKLNVLLAAAAAPRVSGLDWLGITILAVIFFSLGVLSAALLIISCCSCKEQRQARHDEERGHHARPTYVPVFVPVVRGPRVGPGQGKSLQGPTVDLELLYPDLQVSLFISGFSLSNLRQLVVILFQTGDPAERWDGDLANFMSDFQGDSVSRGR